MSSISIDGAKARAGRAKFGERWIGRLTEDEDWFYRRYIEGSANPELKSEPSSIIPGMITYTGFRPWFEVQSPALREKIELARDKYDRMEEQYARVDEWLQDHGFDPNAEKLPAEAVMAALERSFSKSIDCAEPRQVPNDTSSDAPAIAEPAAASSLIRPHIRRTYKRDAVMDALKAVYSKYYSGLTTSVVGGPVINWLKENRPGVEVSDDLIRKALNKFEAETKNS